MKTKAMLRTMWRARTRQIIDALDEAFNNMEKLPNGHYVFRSAPFVDPVRARWRTVARHAWSIGDRGQRRGRLLFLK